MWVGEGARGSFVKGPDSGLGKGSEAGWGGSHWQDGEGDRGGLERKQKVGW